MLPHARAPYAQSEFADVVCTHTHASRRIRFARPSEQHAPVRPRLDARAAPPGHRVASETAPEATILAEVRVPWGLSGLGILEDSRPGLAPSFGRPLRATSSGLQSSCPRHAQPPRGPLRRMSPPKTSKFVGKQVPPPKLPSQIGELDSLSKSVACICTAA